MEITGKIDTILPINAINEKFSKREIILTYADAKGYQQWVKVSFFNSSIELLDAYKVDDDVTITFVLTGRKVTGRTDEPVVFNTLEAHGIKAAKSTTIKNVQKNESMIFLKEGEEDVTLPF